MLCWRGESSREVSRGISPRTQQEEEEEVGNNGRGIMETVPFTHWCVTHSDLKIIRAEIVQAIKDGRIAPHDEDPFDPLDDSIGPSVYTVNTHFIKPVTHKAGDVSYAIMMNRKGIKCDLFVTHAWQEGIFEFIDKVLHSWPPSAKCAYCCMLSNPQNLNINDMIKSPRDSPFAQALDKATYMLVIPNRKGSIYSRLWCVYEISLATQWKKQIYIATRPLAWKYFYAVLHLMGTALLAAALFPTLEYFLTSEVVGDKDIRGIHALSWVEWMLMLFASVAALSSVVLVFSGNTGAQRLINNLGVANLVGWLILNPPTVLWRAEVWDNIDDWDYLFDLTTTLMGLILVPFFLISEYDRLLEVELQYEEEELTHHYTGTVLDAECFSQEDKENIFSDIGDAYEEVDGAVHTLIESGMSTPTLRKAADLGIDVHGAGHSKVASVVVQWLVWLLLMVLQNLDIQEDTDDAILRRKHTQSNPSVERKFLWRATEWNGTLRILIVLLYVCVIPFKPKDGQIFVCRCIVSWSHIMFLVFTPIYAWAQSTMLGIAFQFLSTVFECCVLAFCIVGLANVASIPYAGPFLAQFSISSFSFCCSCFRKKREFKKRERHRVIEGIDGDATSKSASDNDEHFADFWQIGFLRNLRRKLCAYHELHLSDLSHPSSSRREYSRSFVPS